MSCSGSIGGGLARGDSGLSRAMSSASMLSVRLEICDVGARAEDGENADEVEEPADDGWKASWCAYSIYFAQKEERGRSGGCREE